MNQGNRQSLEIDIYIFFLVVFIKLPSKIELEKIALICLLDICSADM